jgi:predicted acyltransferase
VAAGCSLAIFALAYWICEVRGWCRKGWSKGLIWPWLVFGSNAIAAYMISELLGTAVELIHFNSHGRSTNPLSFVQQHFFVHIPDPGWRAFAYSVSYTAVCFIPVWMMYRKKIFLKV